LPRGRRVAIILQMLSRPVSIALETTCREGGVALGSGDELVTVLPFDAARRAATQVVARLDELMRSAGLRPVDIDEIYISCGPGSYTGTRVGVTAARTLVQAVGCKCIGVPTVEAVAANVSADGIEHLAVVLDARRGLIYTARFQPAAEGWLQVTAGQTVMPQVLLAEAPRPLHVVGEGLGYCPVEGPGVVAVDRALWLPTAQGVWAIGRRLSRRRQFTEPMQLRPIYTGLPEAVRKWDKA
jgi:tRNA threonylcarbamoyladenosine biosynthesis protein TsaB